MKNLLTFVLEPYYIITAASLSRVVRFDPLSLSRFSSYLTFYNIKARTRWYAYERRVARFWLSGRRLWVQTL